MNSTQRLIACLRGEPTDRVPINLYELCGWDSRAWENHEPSYGRLMEAIRRDADAMTMVTTAVPNGLASTWDTQVDRWDEADQHVTRTRIHAGGRTLTSVRSHSDDLKTTWHREHPVKDLADLEAYLDLPWEPGEVDFGELERAWAQLDGTRGLPMLTFDDPLCELADVFEFGNFMVHVLTEPRAMLSAMDRIHERRMAALPRLLAGPVASAVIRISGPEYATPPYLSPQHFAQLVTRYDSQYIRLIQQAGAFARIHSHGKVARVLDQIEQMAPDALDPLEPPPDGDIDLAQLKRRVGGRICLIGGIELKDLESRTPSQVAALVRSAIEAGKPGGRYVIMPSAAPINIPLSARTADNCLCLIETALELGKY